MTAEDLPKEWSDPSTWPMTQHQGVLGYRIDGPRNTINRKALDRLLAKGFV